MKVFTYTEARRHLAMLLNTARKEEVVIKRRGGETFSLRYKAIGESPFDVPGIKTRARTKDILAAVGESRSRGADRDRIPSHDGTLPHHHSYGSVSGGSAVHDGSEPREEQPE